MALRKYGAARDQEVTGVEQDGISKQAAPSWDDHDDRELAEENRPDAPSRTPLDDV